MIPRSDVPLETTITNKKLQQKVDTIGEIQGFCDFPRYGWYRPDGSDRRKRGTKTLKGQSQIRSVLGSESLVYKKNDGTELTGWSTLPRLPFSRWMKLPGMRKRHPHIYHLAAATVTESA
ncbi:MAG: hypothetical protein ACLURV_02865 [Gallintestinimicrobium sp.]